MYTELDLFTRSSLKLEDYERLLPKGNSLVNADEVCRSLYKKANIHVFWANAVSNTSNTRSRHIFKLFTNDRQQWERRHWWKTEGWKGSSGGTSETAKCRKKQCESNTSRKINNEEQLLEIWNQKTEHIDEDKTFLLTIVPAFKKPEWWPELLGKDENAGHYEESQKYSISATECTKLYSNDFFTTDVWVKCPISKHIYNAKYSKQKNFKCPKYIGCIIRKIIRIFGHLIAKAVMKNEYSECLYLFHIKL